MKTIIALGLATTSLAITSAPAGAVAFSGTRVNIGPTTPPGTGRCVPPYFGTIIVTPDNFVSTGTSNFGNYQGTYSHCTLGPPPTDFVDGIAVLDFEAGDSLFATFVGTMVLIGSMFEVTSDWTATGGTGRFLDATGQFRHIGTRRGGYVYEGVTTGIYEGTFDGWLNLPAVPEPASWALLILGFGLVGARMRKHGADAMHMQA